MTDRHMSTLKRANAGDLRRFFVAKRSKKDDDEPADSTQGVALPQDHNTPTAVVPSIVSSNSVTTDNENEQQLPTPTTTTTKPTRVVRLRRRGGHIVQDCDVYIGRRWTVGGWDLPQSEWANPYTVRQAGSAAEAVRLYEHAHLAQRPDLVAKVGSLKGLVLGCWCKNKPDDPCHGDVLARLADAWPHACAQEEKVIASET
ncbi:hypothetical protein psal_cds_934 [Pandoravirus salinus]|uniref:DUF4326 domain-containing protein n=1 Tax=Pandoravirus salinus TaxID=1349410 RepID=A0A291ATX5_9VIRU|nr:hypothetical protein psal_cds_934 [Pandoravirus salinus]ATE82257.1 hypothetical protein psal_cds_934 [Pandoravirus salinus]